MYQPEEQLRRLSFDDQITHVLRTPNKIKYKNNQFEGWEDHKEHPLESPDRKIQYATGEKAKFKVKTSRVRIKGDSVRKQDSIIVQNKQNEHTDKMFNLKMIKMIDEQILSPKSRKILTPNKIKRHYDSMKYDKIQNEQLYKTPKTSHRTRQISLKKLSVSEGVNKLNLMSQKRKKHLNDQSFYQTQKQSILNQQTSGFKIPLSAIVYPVLKTNSKKQYRRIQRFHSFVARTVRK